MLRSFYFGKKDFSGHPNPNERRFTEGLPLTYFMILYCVTTRQRLFFGSVRDEIFCLVSTQRNPPGSRVGVSEMEFGLSTGEGGAGSRETPCDPIGS